MLCYLCGRPLSDPLSKDHCPPQFLFSKEVKVQYNANQFITFQVHRDCNHSYSLDEQYFKATLLPLAHDSLAGKSLLEQVKNDWIENERKRNLAERVLSEFKPRPAGLHLPNGLIVKRQDGARIERVAWKIVRGLYLHHHGSILPEAIHVSCTVTAPGRQPPDHYFAAMSLLDYTNRGKYGAIFDYRFCDIETDNGKLNYWALLLWDRIILTVHFHDPWSCDCEICTAAVGDMKIRAAGQL